MRQLVNKVLHDLEPEIKYSIDAENLILGTIAQESGYGKYRTQLGNGPARGICQMEGNTFNDIVNNFLAYHTPIKEKIKQIANVDVFVADDLINNDVLAIAMCRVHYLRVSAQIPTSLNEQALYYKKYYNTMLGKATPEQYIKNFNRYVIPDL